MEAICFYLVFYLSNGVGTTALIITRSLFEYFAGLRFLIKHGRDEAVMRDFRDYGLKVLLESMGGPIPPEFEAPYIRVKKRFIRLRKVAP